MIGTPLKKTNTALMSQKRWWLTLKRMMPIESDVEIFKEKDNATTVTTVEDGYKVCKISFKTRSDVFDNWINNMRVRRKVPIATSALILNFLEDGGKWNKLGWTCRTKFSLIETDKKCVRTDKTCYPRNGC